MDLNVRLFLPDELDIYNAKYYKNELDIFINE